MLKFSALFCCVVLAVAACSPSPNEAHITPTTPPQNNSDGEYDQEIDEALKKMQAQLPIKAGDIMEISTIARTGKSINYTFTVFSEAITPSALGLDQNKSNAIKQLCTETDTKRFLAAGYQMNFHYVFRNQEKVTLSLNHQDC